MAEDQGRNLATQRREQDGLVYFDRGIVEGKDGKRYQRYAVQTHFVEVGESQAALVEKYIRPLYSGRRRAVLRRKGYVYVLRQRKNPRPGQARVFRQFDVAIRGHQFHRRRYARAVQTAIGNRYGRPAARAAGRVS